MVASESEDFPRTSAAAAAGYTYKLIARVCSVMISAPRDDTHGLSFDALDLYRNDKSILGVNSINVSFEDAGKELAKMKDGFESGALKAPQNIKTVDLADEKGVVEAYVEVGKGSKQKQVIVNNDESD